MDSINRIKGWIISKWWWELKMGSMSMDLWYSKPTTVRTLNFLNRVNFPIILISTLTKIISHTSNLLHRNLQQTLRTTGQIQISTLCCPTTWSTALHSNNWTTHHLPNPKTRANCPSWSTITRSLSRIRQICWKSTWKGKSDQMKRNLHIWKFSHQVELFLLAVLHADFFQRNSIECFYFFMNLTFLLFSDFFCDKILSV